MPKIVLTGLSSLEKTALFNIIDSVSDARVLESEDFRWIRQDFVKSGGLILSEAIFIEHLDFFISRRNRVIIVSNSLAHTPDMEYGGMVPVIYRNTDPEIISEYIKNLSEAICERKDNTGELSTREKEVLKELASGKTNKEIADILCISVTTVISHRKNISTKLGIRSISGLSVYALMNGII